MNNIKIKRIVYAASAMGEEAFSDLFKGSLKIPGQQAQKYNRLLQQGLNKNDVEVIAISTPPVTKNNTNKKYVKLKNRKEKGVFYKYTPIINLPGLKNIFFIFHAFVYSICELVKRNTIGICDVLNVSASLGILLAAKLTRKPLIGIVTDIPELMVTGHTTMQVKLCNFIIKECSEYVFLTEEMNTRLNSNSKPYAIIEGIVDEEKIESDKNNHYNKLKRKCLYAGLLDAEYGVKSMVDAFIGADLKNVELHICGAGPYEEELKKIVSDYSNVIFHGSVLNNEVVKLEKECDLLINPRPSVGEFTKYSFPSKIMEYLSSGTVTMSTVLPGIPKEYYQYIIPIEDESVEGIKDILKRTLLEKNEKLFEIGVNAKSWVEMNKNSQMQAKKVLDILRF